MAKPRRNSPWVVVPIDLTTTAEPPICLENFEEDRGRLTAKIDAERIVDPALRRFEQEFERFSLKIRRKTDDLRSKLLFLLEKESAESPGTQLDSLKEQQSSVDLVLRQNRISLRNRLPSLPPDYKQRLKAIIQSAETPNEIVLITKIPIGMPELGRLADGQWLNDQIVDAYLQLISERNSKKAIYPRVMNFSCFHYLKVKDGRYADIKNYTQRVGKNPFEHDLLFFPVSLGAHWCLAVVDFRRKSLAYYDSLSGSGGATAHRVMQAFVEGEWKNRNGDHSSFDWCKWAMSTPRDIPRQCNSYDCGVFACIYAEYLSRNASFAFEQQNMPYFRERMKYELLTKSILIK